MSNDYTKEACLMAAAGKLISMSWNRDWYEHVAYTVIGRGEEISIISDSLVQDEDEVILPIPTRLNGGRLPDTIAKILVNKTALHLQRLRYAHEAKGRTFF